MLRAAERVVVLTGAGISAESGIPTFRGPDGLWRTYRPEDLATPLAFSRDPRLVWEWYDWRRQRLAAAEPNPGHRAIRELEELAPRFTLITQNVDGLHQAAGSRDVVELHGNIWRVRCTLEGSVSELRDVPLPELPPHCPSCGHLLRPDVVWFGEMVPTDALQQSSHAASRADVIVVAGTSAAVYPAASLPVLTKQAGGHLIEVNPDETLLTPIADISFRGSAGSILPQVVHAMRSLNATPKPS
jgi:NAD-dependent deacetylase